MTEGNYGAAPPMTGPAPGMGFVEAIRSCIEQYATFSGRAARSQYWWFTLFSFLVGSITGWLDGGEGWMSIVSGLLLLVPSLAVTSRRLHDVGWSFWWYLVVLLPVIGWLFLLYLLVSKGEPTPNQFG